MTKILGFTIIIHVLAVINGLPLTPSIFTDLYIYDYYDNTTYSPFENISESFLEIINNTGLEENTRVWRKISDGLQGVMTTMGLLLNILTMVTLQRHGSYFKTPIRFLLSHQAFIDMIVCTKALLLISVPQMRLVGKNVLSLLICQVFHSQALYWSLNWISVISLVVIAWERYTAICRPLQHAHITRKRLFYILLSIYIASPFALSLAYVQVKYEHGQCLPVFYFSSEYFADIMRGFSVWCFLIFYAFPCAMFFLMYGAIILTLVRRKTQSQLAPSRVIDTSTAQLTKTAMVVTGWFIVAIGYELWYYLLGYNKVVPYKKNSPVQKAGVFMSGSNSCVNPVIYFMFMPAYRHSVKLTLRCDKPARRVTAVASLSNLTSD